MRVYTRHLAATAALVLPPHGGKRQRRGCCTCNMTWVRARMHRRMWLCAHQSVRHRQTRVTRTYFVLRATIDTILHVDIYTILSTRHYTMLYCALRTHACKHSVRRNLTQARYVVSHRRPTAREYQVVPRYCPPQREEPPAALAQSKYTHVHVHMHVPNLSAHARACTREYARAYAHIHPQCFLDMCCIHSQSVTKAKAFRPVSVCDAGQAPGYHPCQRSTPRQASVRTYKSALSRGKGARQYRPEATSSISNAMCAFLTLGEGARPCYVCACEYGCAGTCACTCPPKPSS